MKSDPIFLLSGNFSVYWYGLIIAAAVGTGVAVSCFAQKLRKKNVNHILLAALISMPIALFGARLYYKTFGIHNLVTVEQQETLKYGGFALYGAFIGLLAGCALTALIVGCKLGDLLDASAPGIAAAVAVGRWASVFSGESQGMVIDSPALQKLPFAIYNNDEHLWRDSLFFYESLLAAGLCVAFIMLIKSAFNGEKKFTSGDIYLLFVITFCLTNGLFEDRRCDPLFFVNEYVTKLQTVRVSFALGGLFSAVALAILLLRRMFREGIKLPTVMFCLGCAVFYFGYFCTVLRVCTDNELLNFIIVTVSGLVLISFGFANVFYMASNLPGKNKGGAPKKQQSSRSRASRENSSDFEW